MTTTNQVQQDDQATVLEDLRQRVREEYHYAREVSQICQQQSAHRKREAQMARDHMTLMGWFIDSCADLKAEAVAGKDVETRATELAAKIDDAIRQHENDSAK